MSNTHSDNIRIAKNTILLYVRTILVMLVSLYTSRVVLNTLGIEDFGVYNAVGGVVSMFALLSGALSSAIGRYITYGLGKADNDELKIVFCTSVNIQVFLSIIILIACEFIGVWFLNNKMNIPADRMIAANWVLQLSLLTFVVNLISVPYNACIIAHEHMNAYAYISIADVILKLCVAYLLIISPFDKLIIYALLLFIASLGVRLLYGLYCRRNFQECKYRFVHNKKLFVEMLRFAGWNFLGNATSVLNTQGVNLLINVFFGVLANSARGIASQVEAAVNQFVFTFTTAVNPQITKSFAQGDSQRMNYLVCKGAKFAFFLLLFFALPIIFETDSILTLWLGNVPEGASLFVKLSLVGAMVTVLGNTCYTACIATGDIKKYSIIITVIGSMNFVLTWIAYKMGASVEMTYFIYIGVYVVVLIARLFLMKEMLNFPVIMYVREVIGKIIIPSIAAIFLPVALCRYIEPSVERTLVVCITSMIWTGICVYILGLTRGERSIITEKTINFTRKLLKKMRK